jgi:chorismate mutase / prephenate dehydratase
MSARGSGSSGARRGGSGDSTELRGLRERIDALDRQIVALVNERAELTRAVGVEKEQLGRAIRDAGREREVLLRVSMANAGPTPQADLLAIYRRLIASARGLETRQRERLRREGTHGDGEAPPA